MKHIVSVCDRLFVVELPSTAAEVYEYRVRILGEGWAAESQDESVFVPMALEWLRQYVDADDRPWLNGANAVELAQLCEAVCAAADPPPWMVVDLRKRLMAQEKVTDEDIDMFESVFDDAPLPTVYAARIAFSLVAEPPLSLDLPPWAHAFARVAHEVRGMVAKRHEKRRENMDETVKIGQRYGLEPLPAH